MKKRHYYLLSFCMIIGLAACNKEDAGTQSGSKVDKPISLIGSEAKAYQQRMEVP